MDKAKLNKLIKYYKKRLKEEEKNYNEKLTKLDEAVNALINSKTPHSISELKDSLNKIYKTKEIFLGKRNLPIYLRKIINKIGFAILEPYMEAQQEYNSQLIHFINELMNHLEEIREREKILLDSLIQFSQRIIALIDVKALEVHYKNYNDLLKMQDTIKEEMEALKESLMIAYEELDRKLTTFIAWRMREKDNKN